MSIKTRDVIRILLIIAGFVLLGALLLRAFSVIVMIFVAYFLALILNQPILWFEKRFKRNQRVKAIIVVVALLSSVLIGLIWALLPPLVAQTHLLIENIPSYATALKQHQGPIVDVLRDLHIFNPDSINPEDLGKNFAQFVGPAVDFVAAAFNSVVRLFTVLGLMVFMMLEGPRWRRAFWRLTGEHYQRRYGGLVHQMYLSVANYARGNILISVCATFSAFIAMLILKVPYSVPLSILVGILDLIPIIGATLGALVVVTVCLFISTKTAVLIAIFFIAYQIVENTFLSNFIYGKSNQISPLTVFIASLFGANIAGLLGALVAIPVASSLDILVRDYLRFRYQEQSKSNSSDRP